MWIRDVDVPAALIDAHRTGSLVIFVGAGASRDAPASLPLFTELTEGVARDAVMSVDVQELKANPDVVLGRLHDRDVDVHALVAKRIGVSASRPNRLHEALIELVVAGGTVRVVTTNYDASSGSYRRVPLRRLTCSDDFSSGTGKDHPRL